MSFYGQRFNKRIGIDFHNAGNDIAGLTAGIEEKLIVFWSIDGFFCVKGNARLILSISS